MNDERVSTATLKKDDIIGVGCNREIMAADNDKRRYYVFKLTNAAQSVDRSPIYISDDDDQERMNEPDIPVPGVQDDQHDANVEPVLSTVKTEAGENDIVQAIVTECSSDNNGNDVDEDNEIQYSQQCLREIKQEVGDNYSFEAHEKDFIVCEDSNDEVNPQDRSAEKEDDMSLSQWSSKLSQDQDLVLKQLIDTIDCPKRKATKEISALPEKLKRRRSSMAKVDVANVPNVVNVPKPTVVERPSYVSIDMTDDAQQVSKPAESQPPKSDKCDKVNSKAKHDSSRSNSDKGTSKRVMEILVTATTSTSAQSNIKENTSLEAALNGVDTIRRPSRRIAHIPKEHSSNLLKSILRPAKIPGNGIFTHNRANRKCVTFRAKPHICEIFYFDKKANEDDEIIVSPHAKHVDCTQKVATQRQDILIEIDSLERLINEITEWDPAWLSVKEPPPINGLHFVADPLMDEYPNIELYHQ